MDFVEMGAADDDPGRGEPILRLKDIHKSYGDNHVLRGVSLDVARGEVVAIIGPSGGGKSTLLRCVNFLEYPDSGEVRFENQPIGQIGRSGFLGRRQVERQLVAYRAQVGMVFQHFNLFPHFSVLQNIIEGPVSVRGLSSAQAVTAAERLLDRFGLLAKRDVYPSQLSGGQQQRVAVIRSLAMEPKIMLFDEPTSALDAELVGEVLDVMKQLAMDGMTMLVVSHEMSFVREAADRAVFMDHGTIVEQGTAREILTAPKAERTRQFMSKLRS